MSDSPISFEVYSLTLTHYIQDDNGRHHIDEPLVVRTCVNRSNMVFPVCVNEIVERMMQMMREKVLSKEETPYEIRFEHTQSQWIDTIPTEGKEQNGRV